MTSKVKSIGYMIKTAGTGRGFAELAPTYAEIWLQVGYYDEDANIRATQCCISAQGAKSASTLKGSFSAAAGQLPSDIHKVRSLSLYLQGDDKRDGWCPERVTIDETRSDGSSAKLVDNLDWIHGLEWNNKNYPGYLDMGLINEQPTKVFYGPKAPPVGAGGSLQRTIIVSDLHLGNGTGFEIFAGEKELPALLDSVAKAPTRVIINGDGVDFLMNEDPPELDPARAVAQAREIVASPVTAGVLLALGRVLARGGEVIIRLGNHDVELALLEVQAIFRDALKQPQEIAARLSFDYRDAPTIIDVGGAKILVTHGDNHDVFNRVTYDTLHRPKDFRYPPGSIVVREFMNPLIKEYDVRFINLLKPDFQGAVLAVMAVAPQAAKIISNRKEAVRRIIDEILRTARGGSSFAEDDEESFGLDARVEQAGLDAEERAALEEYFGDGPASFAADETVLTTALVKLGREGLKLYAMLQRWAVGQSGEKYFLTEPNKSEWDEAKRLASKFQVGAVVTGHTHSARWREADGVAYANTGTWIRLMRLPKPDESIDVWAKFLEELRSNPTLDPDKQHLAKITPRFTAVLCEPHPESGATMSLLEWDGKDAKTLGTTRLSSKER
jgi:UDP-2,3-diacylglucosamine pyrophosphatase LpxH